MSAWFHKNKSPEALGGLLGEAYRRAFSADTFHQMFPADSLNGADVEVCLAEWYAFGAFAFTYCVWHVYKEQKTVFPILDYFQPAVRQLFEGNEHIRDTFLAIASKREKDYMDSLTHMKDGTDLSRLCGRVVAHITGIYSQEAESGGFPQVADVSLVVMITEYMLAVIKTTSELIQ